MSITIGFVLDWAFKHLLTNKKADCPLKDKSKVCFIYEVERKVLKSFIFLLLLLTHYWGLQKLDFLTI